MWRIHSLRSHSGCIKVRHFQGKVCVMKHKVFCSVALVACGWLWRVCTVVYAVEMLSGQCQNLRHSLGCRRNRSGEAARGAQGLSMHPFLRICLTGPECRTQSQPVHALFRRSCPSTALLPMNSLGFRVRGFLGEADVSLRQPRCARLVESLACLGGAGSSQS